MINAVPRLVEAELPVCCALTEAVPVINAVPRLVEAAASRLMCSGRGGDCGQCSPSSG